ncbi:MAG: AraC family transcriptional regulator [Treponema sp.]|jgi:AraC-like DNA-binding protein|nr:AraC family transcriptional regulator [Treponema sp.]
MYYPIQIPYILSKKFAAAVRYSEEVDLRLKDFVTCFWEMKNLIEQEKTIENIIVADGCIDLVADFSNKLIGFVGMSKTNFEFKITTSCRFYGARMKPGAFYALTGISAAKVMDGFLPLKVFDSDFDEGAFFRLFFDDAKIFMKEYIAQLCAGKNANDFIELFDELSEDIPDTAESIYERLHFSPKQTQRLFAANFGLTPRVVLSIVRFQKCLEVLTSGKASPGDVLNLVNFYDQAHFINDFKRNIGLTPFELVRRYS